MTITDWAALAGALLGAAGLVISIVGGLKVFDRSHRMNAHAVYFWYVPPSARSDAPGAHVVINNPSLYYGIHDVECVWTTVDGQRAWAQPVEATPDRRVLWADHRTG